jgi:circadian clock protein KaiC
LGQVRRAVSVIKKRTGPHEQTIREFLVTSQGLSLGAPIEGFQGVLQGMPSFSGAADPLLKITKGSSGHS